jgi:hypothetical protein
MMHVMKKLLPLGLTVLLLCGMAGERLSRPSATDAEPYHRRVKEAIEAFPLQFGDWRGEDNAVPPSAIQLLKPNAIVSRHYRNVQTGQEVTLLFEHCKDARDMMGHYPPVCYPANGWVSRESRATIMQAGGLSLPAVEYDFSRVLPDRSMSVTVVCGFILPDGRLESDMRAVRRLASDYRAHFFGSAQVQLAFGEGVGVQERAEIIRQLLEPAVPAIQTVRKGIKR